MANQERNTEATVDAMSSSSDYNLSLPRDIIFDILNHLPVKSLLRFKCICKTFCQLISSPTFISSHLLHHPNPPPPPPFSPSNNTPPPLSLCYNHPHRLNTLSI
ncbi:F-box protein [Camellia lanceoleosa]|uniref:F-box protein n=1 Tax=Camellia lanceoleosa TaxID=1840588 RepID=A0ACC0IMJ7_9ERIC|nr:F-box protein [Camellia lanceoleosa]